MDEGVPATSEFSLMRWQDPGIRQSSPWGYDKSWSMTTGWEATPMTQKGHFHCVSSVSSIKIMNLADQNALPQRWDQHRNLVESVMMVLRSTSVKTWSFPCRMMVASLEVQPVARPVAVGCWPIMSTVETWHPPPTTCWILYCIPSKPVVLPARLVVNHPLNFDLCPMCPQAKVMGSGGYYGISHITEHFFLTTKERCFLLNVPSSNSRIVYMVCTSPHERTAHLPTFLAQLRFRGKLPRSSGCLARPPQAG
jgi:hypothetical protein